MTTERIAAGEHAARRKKTLTALKGATGLVFAGSHDPMSMERFRPHPHFEYLTGIVDEPGAILLLDSSHPTSSRRQMLFLGPLNAEREKWDGYRLQIGASLREQTGFETIFRTDAFGRMLNAAAIRSKRLACLHPLAVYHRPVSPDLEVFRKVQQRVPGVTIEDRTEVLARLRAVKSRHELALIQRAVDITAEGYDAMMRAVRPGLNEFEVQETLERQYRAGGSRSPAFATIVGSGVNSTVLHYNANDRTLEEGDLICIDSGATWGGYGADITRTIPVSGKFSPRQREVYEVVLAAEVAAIKAVKPGVSLPEIDDVARTVITQAGYADYFIHSIGHHLGLETHDISPEEPLKQGAVVTIEPGIYIPDEAIGIRIEDDVVVTANGSRNLSAKIPKTIAAVEKTMT